MMLRRMSGESDPGPLKTLASVVQPPLDYEREGLAHFDVYSPLNRMVDAVPPESDTARQFSQIVSRITSGKATPEDLQRARAWLQAWRDNDAAVQPLLQKSQLTQELVPLSHDIAQVSVIGLRALDAIENHRTQDKSATDADLQFLKQAEKPKAVLRNMIVAPVEQLVGASSGTSPATPAN
jgi:hexosaminidase